MNCMLKYVGYSILFVSLFCSCSTTKLSHVWHNDAYKGRAVNDILVLGISKESAVRRSYETTFVEKLRAVGVEAETSFSMLPDSGELEKEEIVDAVKKAGADAVIITHLVRLDKKEVHQPGEVHVVDDYYGYYGRTFHYVHAPRTYSIQTTVVLETNLYLAADEKLMWSARSETIHGGSDERLIDSVIKAVVDNLKAKGLLAPK